MSAATDQITYDDLYSRWEKGNWRATEIDFSQDKVDWHERFGDVERRAALWNYALFFHGEDSVADNLSPYIDAAPREEQKYFLATQQVDEARHAVFFKRFMHEVVEAGDGSVASALDATRPELTWGFRKTFERLDKMADELRRDRSKPKLAAAITLYHVVIEAALAQPGQHFIESYLVDRDVLPGFREGMRNVSLDEQRHIGFGVKLLSDLVREDPECVHAVEELLKEVLPWTAAVLVPPGWDRSYVECFGFTLEDIYEQGAMSLEAKLRAAGIDPNALNVPLRFDLPARERGERGLKLLAANMLGEKLGPPVMDAEAIEILFDSVAHQADSSAVPSGTTIQWEFPDAEPWYLTVDNGATSVAQGRVPKPDVTLRCSFEDWVDIAAGRQEPRTAILRRKLRPRGRVRVLAKLPALLR